MTSKLQALKDLENPKWAEIRERKKKQAHEYYLRHKEHILEVQKEYRKTHPVDPESVKLYREKVKIRYRYDAEFRQKRIDAVKRRQAIRRAEMGEEAYRAMCNETVKRNLAKRKAKALIESGQVINFNV